MTQLIRITEQNGSKAVSARELHQFLGVNTKFYMWIERRIEEYGFVENEDYQIMMPNFGQRKNEGGFNKKEYAISLDMAKELAMVEKTDKGKQARRYFIECEKRLQNVQKALPQASQEAQRLELLNLIRNNLQRGDVKAISVETGLGEKTLGLVKNGMKAKPIFIQALYAKALENKKSGKIISYHEMINQLKG